MAADIWSYLQERFSQGNDSRIFQIKQNIIQHRQGRQSISAYYTELKALWDDLSSYQEPICYTCGEIEKLKKREENKRVMKFLMGLNDNYTAVRGKNTTDATFPGHTTVHSLILQQEKQAEVSSNRGNRTTLL